MTERLSSLIAEIYDAAVAPELWPQTLDKLRGFVGGQAATLYWQDISDASAGMFYSVGDDPHYRQLYMEQYAALNPLYPAVYFVEPGKVMSSGDIVPFEELHQSRFYLEWQKPQGIVDGAVANLEKTSTSMAAMAIMRGEEHGRVDEEARRRMMLIVPHMMRAVGIGHLVERHKAKSAMLTDTLGALESGVFMVGADGHIAFSNEAGDKLLREGAIVRSSQGGLHASEPDSDKALYQAIDAANSGDVPAATKSVAVNLKISADARWLAHVLPLTNGARRAAGAAHSAVAAIFIRKAGFDVPSALETLAKLHKLTAGEVRVLQAIVNLGGVPEAASALGVSEATARTHLQRVFAKTGTRRQADLVKLVAGMTNPLAG